MYRADRLAMTGGVAGAVLMEAAGRAVAEAVMARESPAPLLVLCGPGNNGGDGFVAARILAEAGWPVEVALLGEAARLRGDAAHHAGLWQGEIRALQPSLVDDAAIVIDALFGAGLTRPLEGAALACVAALNARGLACYAVDVPSGVSGDSGALLGAEAVKAKASITFFRRKPGHLLLPGSLLCGEVVVADIGIPAAVLDEICPATWANEPGLWLPRYPWRGPLSHKYHFGHALVSSGPTLTGAAKLGAQAALRVGAGLVSIACSPATFPIFATTLASIMCPVVAQEADFSALLANPRINAVLIGPGAGVTEETRARVLGALTVGKNVVLDADALTAFSSDPEALFAAIAGNAVVLTPHDGEFARLFPDLKGDRLTRARVAAARSGAGIILKGADSVVATPEGRAAINSNGPPELATAGAGDVLAGFVVGLLAQGLDAFDASCAAVWLHGAAAGRLGPGLIAEDLPQALPEVLRDLR
jgi:NAD(P)H-hydrate epimerase